MPLAQVSVMFDGLVDEGEHVRVLYAVDLAAAVSPGGDQVSEAQLGQVLADGRDGGPDCFGQAGDVVFALGEEPQQMHPSGGGEQGEGLGRFGEVDRFRRADIALGAGAS